VQISPRLLTKRGGQRTHACEATQVAPPAVRRRMCAVYASTVFRLCLHVRQADHAGL
jgi:hypothetical protein